MHSLLRVSGLKNGIPVITESYLLICISILSFIVLERNCLQQDPNLEFPSRTLIPELSLHIPAVFVRVIDAAALVFLKFIALPGKSTYNL